MTDKWIIIDGKTIGCPCYINRPLYRYDKACLVQSQAFTGQQTEEKPILRCDEIKNCPIKENYKQLKAKEQECEMLNKQLISFMNGDYCKNDCSLKQQLKLKEQECKELKEQFKLAEPLYQSCNIKDKKINKLKAILAEIKEIADKDFRHTAWEEYAKQLKQIIQKISECEVENAR